MILADKLLQENWRLMSVPEYWNSAYGSVLFTRTNYTIPTVAVSTVSAPLASVSMEHKAVFWSNSVADFKTSAENDKATQCLKSQIQLLKARKPFVFT